MSVTRGDLTPLFRTFLDHAVAEIKKDPEGAPTLLVELIEAVVVTCSRFAGLHGDKDNGDENGQVYDDIAKGILGLADTAKRDAHLHLCFWCDLLRPAVHKKPGEFLHLPEGCPKCRLSGQVFGYGE